MAGADAYSCVEFMGKERKDFVALTDCVVHGPRTKWVARQSEFLGDGTIHLCDTLIEFKFCFVLREELSLTVEGVRVLLRTFEFTGHLFVER